MSNDYYEEFTELQDKSTFRGQQWFGERQRLVEEYSWAVPSDDVIAYLSEFDHLYEVGAGSGYWANLIDEAGGDVTAFDIESDEEWYTVHEKEAAQLDDTLNDEPVLMVWPPLNSPMAEDVLFAQPSHVCYVGEPKGGCTGTDKFHERLERNYGLVARIEIPSYACVRDDFYHYARKA